MSGLVYHAINAVTAELAQTGIAKARRNDEGEYDYRGIEDVLRALAPLLALHKLCVLPRVTDREASRVGPTNGQAVVVRMAFDLVSAIDGSVHVVESFGEAVDDSDKGTAKAISAAYKSAMLQAFCIPVPQLDADAYSPRSKTVTSKQITVAEPPEGWECWAGEVIDITRTCESPEAVDRLCSARRQMLGALQRSRADVYAQVGEAIAAHLAELQRGERSQPSSPNTKRQSRKRDGAKADGRQAAQAA